MNYYLFALLGFFGLLFLTRNIKAKAAETLSTEQKAKLIDLFSKSNRSRSLILFGIVGIYFLILEFYPEYTLISALIFFLIMLAIFTFVSMKSLATLKANDFPMTYIQKYKMSNVLMGFGLFLMSSIIFIQIIG